MANQRSGANAISSDLTTGSISQHFKNMAVPMAIGMVFSTLYNVVDTFYAGLISTQAQAGLAIASLVFMLLIALGFGVTTALSALVGNALGESNEAEAKHISRQGIGFGFLLSLVLTIIGLLFAPKLVSLVSEPGEYREAANSYLFLVLTGITFFIVAFSSNGILQANGDTRSMKRAQMVAFFANLALNPLFIFGIPGFFTGIGFDGLALSTLVSQMGVMFYLLHRLYKREIFYRCGLSQFIPEANAYKAILAQALPSSFSMMVMMIAGFVIQYFLKGFGSHAVAGYGIALRIEQLLLLPIFGLTGSLLPIAAQNFGAKNFDRVREAAFFSFKVGCTMMLIAGVLLWLFGEYALLLFTRDPAVIEVGYSYLKIDGLILWTYMLLFAFNSMFQALKQPIWSLWVSVYRQGIGVAFFGYLYVVILGLGVWGVWFGIATSVLTGFVLSAVLLQRLAAREIGGLFWRNHQLN